MFSAQRKSIRDSTRDVQKLINICSHRVVISEDGYMGPKTIAAMQRLTLWEQGLVTDLANVRKVVFEDITNKNAKSSQYEPDLNVDYNQRLGKTRFTLADLTLKPAANSHPHKIWKRNGAIGISSSEVISNLTEVAGVLERIWSKFPGKFRINSGFRAGTSKSAHEIGSAVDITTVAGSNTVEGQKWFKELARFVVTLDSFDQIISEAASRPRDVWLHIGLKRQDGSRRGLVSSGIQGASFEQKYSDKLVDWHSKEVVATKLV